MSDDLFIYTVMFNFFLYKLFMNIDSIMNLSIIPSFMKIMAHIIITIYYYYYYILLLLLYTITFSIFNVLYLLRTILLSQMYLGAIMCVIYCIE